MIKIFLRKHEDYLCIFKEEHGLFKYVFSKRMGHTTV